LPRHRCCARMPMAIAQLFMDKLSLLIREENTHTQDHKSTTKYRTSTKRSFRYIDIIKNAHRNVNGRNMQVAAELPVCSRSRTSPKLLQFATQSSTSRRVHAFYGFSPNWGPPYHHQFPLSTLQRPFWVCTLLRHAISSSQVG